MLIPLTPKWFKERAIQKRIDTEFERQVNVHDKAVKQWAKGYKRSVSLWTQDGKLLLRWEDVLADGKRHTDDGIVCWRFDTKLGSVTIDTQTGTVVLDSIDPTDPYPKKPTREAVECQLRPAPMAEATNDPKAV